MTMSTLSKGAKGDNVKTLQQALINSGHLDPKYNTGFYGPKTEDAVKKYQSSNGLPSNGQWDQGTQTSYNNNALQPMVDTHPTLDPSTKGMLEQMRQNNDPRYATLANAVQGGYRVSPAMLANAAQDAYNSTATYYNQDRQNAGGALQNYLNTATSNYDTNTGEIKNEQNLASMNMIDDQGQHGVAGTPEAAMRLKSLNDSYNSRLASAYNTTAGDVNSKLQGQEYQYGAAAVPSVSIAKYQGTPSSGGTTQSSTSASVYNPFHFVGRMNAQQTAENGTATNENLTAQYYNPNKGI